jgi:hypothetical protein
LWLCFEAKAGEAKTSNNRAAAKIFFMLKMYHDPAASGSPGIKSETGDRAAGKPEKRRKLKKQ